jgi:hypothetical protein
VLDQRRTWLRFFAWDATNGFTPFAFAIIAP